MPSPSRASALRLRADLLDVDAVTPGTDFHILLRLSLVDPTSGAASSSASASASARVRGVDVAWHGVERLDPAWVRPSSSRGGGGDGALALGERYVARSPAGTIATDTTVAPGEAREHVVGVRLPPGLPPTYRGSVARVAYRVTFVATYTLGDEDDATTRAETLRVPLRVLSENADAAAVENAFDHLWSVSTAGAVPAPWSRDENGVPPRHPSSPLGSPGSPLAAAFRRRLFVTRLLRRAREASTSSSTTARTSSACFPAIRSRESNPGRQCPAFSTSPPRPATRGACGPTRRWRRERRWSSARGAARTSARARGGARRRPRRREGARPPEGVGGDVRTHRGDAEDALRVGDSGGGAPDVSRRERRGAVGAQVRVLRRADAGRRRTL